MNFRCCGYRYNSNAFQVVLAASICMAVFFSLINYKLKSVPELKNSEFEYFPKYPGSKGTAVFLPRTFARKFKNFIELGWQKYKFNKFVSDLIPLNRTLPDAQDEWCKQPERFKKHLPATDIIICFHNEAWSTLLRTVHSIINRSPDYLIAKIILVDDYSLEAHLKEPLNKYFSKFPKVKLVRASKRLGVVKARLLGLKHSTASIVTYLDSHCECMQGWLEPLLDRVARDPSTVVSPFIDDIDMDTFQYYVTALGREKYVGGFNWNLEYNWITLSARENRLHENSLEPHPTPTIAGGLFAIDRNFFLHLGTYDETFEYWGYENLELSFRTWMCGGRLEIVYCSRVGHVYREETPHKFPFADKILLENAVRLADVWMDDYAEIFYKSRGPGFNLTAALSDVTERKLLRKTLACKSFKWYLENVYPEKFVPVVMGAIMQMHTNLCLEADDEVGEVYIFECHNQGKYQFWMIGNFSEIRKDNVCLTVNKSTPELTMCDKATENNHLLFDLRTHRIFNNKTKKCLSLSKGRSNVLMEKCQRKSWRQEWILK